MKRISAKLRDASGVSMVLALGIMMVVSIVCVSTLKVASSAPRAAYAQQDLEQSYLAATSAAKLVKHVFDSDKNKALQLLQKMDESSTDHGITNGFSEDFQLQLSNAGADATIVNKLNTAKVTLTKTADDTVTVSISDSGYPANFSLPVETIVWKDNTGAERAKTTYPNGYLSTHTPIPPEDYDSGGFSYTYSGVTPDSGTNTYTSERMWKVLWIDGSGAVVASVDCGVEQPTTQPDTTSISSITSQFSGFSKWDWEHAVVNATDKTIIVPPVFLSTDSTYNEYRAIWESVPTVTYSGGSFTITSSPAYKPFALQSYTIKWLNGDGSVMQEQTISEGQQETPPSTDPTKAPDGAYYSYTFNGWDGGTMNSETSVKTYTPQFTGATESRTVIWEDGDGSTLDTRYYQNGDTTPSANSTSKVPTKAPDGNGWKYDFTGWNNAITAVTDKVTTYKPQFTHTVKWLNGDGNELESKTFIAYPTSDTEPPTPTNTPTKAADGDWAYTFKEWSSATYLDGIKTYTPQFTHTVQWLDGDETTVLQKQIFIAYPDSVKETETTTFNGTTPTKKDDDTGSYVFNNSWDITYPSGVKTYIPKFDSYSSSTS